MMKASHIRNFQPPPKDIAKDIGLVNRLVSPFNGGEVSGSVADGFGVIEKRSLDLDAASVERSFAKRPSALKTAWTVLASISKRWRGTKSRVDCYPVLKGRVYYLAQAVTCCTDYDARLHGYRDAFDMIMSDGSHPRQDHFLAGVAQELPHESQHKMLLDGLAKEYAGLADWAAYVSRERAAGACGEFMSWASHSARRQEAV
jgi:hypothetical protein